VVGRKLKVFQAQFGFYDTVVAAPSQAAALRAWGVNQNLFASGQAKATTDKAAITAATANPETPLRRAVGSSDPFELQPSSLPKIPDSKSGAKSKPAPPAKPPADRSKLDSAEKALRDLDEARKSEEADLRREEDALQARMTDAQAAYVSARKKATSKVVDARTVYRKAGGKD
jgi:type IV secretory pathway VirB10-like protein